MRVLVLALVLLVGCRRSTLSPTSDRNVIRESEISSVQAATAYDIVAKLRGEFLKSRGPVSASRGRATEKPLVTVFLDGVESGPADAALRLIPASTVVEIRMYRAGDATTKYGSRHSGGVLEVLTRRAVRP